MRWPFPSGVVVCAAAAATLLNACDRSVDGVAVASSDHFGARAAKACADHRSTSVDVGFDTGEMQLSMSPGDVLWFQFHDDHYGTLSPLASSDSAVVGVRSSLRCPHGVRLFAVVGTTNGHATLTATLTPPTGSLAPGIKWQIGVSVADHGRTQPPPAVAARLRGGGLLVYPKRLNSSGVEAEFQVPSGRCRPGATSRTDIGLFGTERLISPDHASGYIMWSAGLSIDCSTTGSPAYRIGWDGGAQIGEAEPGDRVGVSVGGADCPTLTISVAPADNQKPGRGGGRGCRSGTRDQIQIEVQPSVLIGATVSGDPARSRLAMDSITVNGLPYWKVPHAFRKQVVNDQTRVTASSTPGWYELKLAID